MEGSALSSQKGLSLLITSCQRSTGIIFSQRRGSKDWLKITYSAFIFFAKIIPFRNLYKQPFMPSDYEEKFPSLEEERSDALEVAAQANAPQEAVKAEQIKL